MRVTVPSSSVPASPVPTCCAVAASRLAAGRARARELRPSNVICIQRRLKPSLVQTSAPATSAAAASPRRRPSAPRNRSPPPSSTRPSPNRSDASARSVVSPSAFSTCDGSACVHAAPDDTATSSQAHQQRFAVDAGEAHVQVARQPRRPASRSPSSRPSSRASRRAADRAAPPTRVASLAISARAIAAARPNPTMPGTFNVPDRMPRSWPPPSICAAIADRAALRRDIQRADALRPVDLVRRQRREVDVERLDVERHLARRPAPRRCAATRPSRARAPRASVSGCNTPISLFAAITLTSAVRSVTASASASRSIKPVALTGSTVTRQPSCASRATGRAPTCARSPPSRGDRARRAAPAASALDREVVGLGRAAREDDLLAARADQRRDLLRARARPRRCASQPNRCCLLAALPNFSVKNGSIASSTRASTGVVAWWSR